MINEEMQKRLDKVYLEVNEAENALGRALYAIKALKEEILAHVCDHTDCGEHSHEPAPTDPVEPTPVPTEPEPTPPVAETPVEPEAPVATTPIWHKAPAIVTLTQEQMDAWTKVSTNYHGPGSGGEGAFRFFGNCTGEINHDDVLLLPGQPGKAHPHIYTGLPGVNAFSTLDSMLQTEETYWVGNQTMRPAMWHPVAYHAGDEGRAKVHDYVLLYYKQYSHEENVPSFPAHWTNSQIREIWEEGGNAILAAEPTLTLTEARQKALLIAARAYHAEQGTKYGTENLPNGLCFIGGHHMDGTPGNCEYRLMVNGKQYKGGTIPKAIAAWHADGGSGDTPVGSTLTENVSFSDCWNGELGSADFRSHLSGRERNDRTYWMAMPKAEYPRRIVSVTTFRSFKQREGEAPLNTLRLVSDQDGMEGGSTGHCDYITLHPEPIRTTWYENIIRGVKSASTSGNTINYGGITAMNPNHSLDGWKGMPRYLDIPARPDGVTHEHHH